MSTELALFVGFILHFVGDYLLQSDWMATNKTKNSAACLLHVAVYSAPFYFICDFAPLIVLISVTHFLIDRFRLAKYWMLLINWDWHQNSPDRPAYISFWLLVIVDNTFHIIFNSLAIFLSYQ